MRRIGSPRIGAGMAVLSILMCVNGFAELDRPIFEWEGYRIGAYPDGFEQSADGKPIRLRKPFRRCDTVCTSYEHGRLSRFCLVSSDRRRFDGKMDDELLAMANEVVARNPSVRFSEMRQEDGSLFCLNCKIPYGEDGVETAISISGNPFRVDVNGNWQNRRDHFHSHDRFQCPERPEPITKIFGVVLGMTIEQMMEEIMKDDGLYFETVGRNCGGYVVYRFIPRKQFLQFLDYYVEMNEVGWNSRKVVAITAVQKNAEGCVDVVSGTKFKVKLTDAQKKARAYARKRGLLAEERDDIHEVVDILREKYGIRFLWQKPHCWAYSEGHGLHAEYWGCGDDYTVLQVDSNMIRLSQDSWRKREDEWRRERKEERRTEGPRKEREDVRRREALEAL